MRTLHASIVGEKNKLAATAAWLTLVEVEIDPTTTARLVPNPEPITFGGQVYTPFPLRIDSVTTDSQGGLHETEVAVSNVTREMSAFVEQYDLRGRRVRLVGVQSLQLDDPTKAVFDEDYEIVGIEVTEQLCTFRLGHPRLLEQMFPSRRVLRDNCQWLYKSDECGYSGELATCDKTLEGTNGCRVHANVARFGAFPAMPVVLGRIS